MLLAHFSDLHVTLPPGRIRWRDLRSKRLLGWLNLKLLGRAARFAGAPAIAAALARDLEALDPAAILSTGDLTGLALREEFEEAAAALRPLLDDERVTGIPGNHDVYTPESARARLYEGAFGAWTRTEFAAADLPERARSLWPYPLVRRLGSRWALIAARDVSPTALHDSGGRVGSLQLEAIEAAARHEHLRGRRLILAIHTSPLRASGRPDRPRHRLHDGPALLAAAARAGIDVLVHGHIHGRFVLGRDAGDGPGLLIANPGSVSARDHDRAYHVLDLEADSVRVGARRYDAARGRFEAWPDAPGSRVYPLAERA